MTESQHLNAPSIDRIVDINLSDSMYVKPMRAFYKMVCKNFFSRF